ncbi:MAG TPA: FKBP-type peptidyl-prolyl cis-trans isomerase [Rhizomicrobium sp.]|jgi:FKBP-type peptidyl-prolyl cis-trans isomerase|nr:FKBP-type peptidyl-prolyl cis-trans isomerase [Rhizomicrobium sp.]
MRLLSLAALAAALMVTAAVANPQVDYLTANAKKPGVKVVDGGLQYKVIKSGKGKRPGSSDCATVNYKGSFIDGRVFDASKPGQPITFPVQGVIKGWTMALQMMHEGDEWELTIPSSLGYGDRGTPGGPIPGGATLVFDVTLLKVSPSQMAQCPG